MDEDNYTNNDQKENDKICQEEFTEQFDEYMTKIWEDIMSKYINTLKFPILQKLEENDKYELFQIFKSSFA